MIVQQVYSHPISIMPTIQCQQYRLRRVIIIVNSIDYCAIHAFLSDHIKIYKAVSIEIKIAHVGGYI